jgi:hypothetical protein
MGYRACQQLCMPEAHSALVMALGRAWKLEQQFPDLHVTGLTPLDDCLDQDRRLGQATAQSVVAAHAIVVRAGWQVFK